MNSNYTDNFDKIKINYKDGVDPNWLDAPISGNQYIQESDDYFSSLDKTIKYDLIFIDSPINHLKDMIKQQLNNELGKIIMIQKVANYLNHAYKIIKNNNNYTKEYLFDVFTKYELYEESEGFVF